MTAAGYYRGDQRFSAGTNAERIRSAQRGAADLAGAAARARDFDEARQRAWVALRAAPPGRVVLTRHGDRMLLAEFLRTRVLELAVHGLDLAAGLDRAPWMTAPAAEVTEDLLLPAAAAARLRAGNRLGPCHADRRAHRPPPAHASGDRTRAVCRRRMAGPRLTGGHDAAARYPAARVTGTDGDACAARRGREGTGSPRVRRGRRRRAESWSRTPPPARPRPRWPAPPAAARPSRTGP